VKQENGFPWQYPENGGWKWGMGSLKMSDLLYGSDGLLDNVHTVIMLEGEKDVETCRSIFDKPGVAFVSGPGGAGNPSLDWTRLANLPNLRHLFIFFDADEAGREGVQKYGLRAVNELPNVEVKVYAGSGDSGSDVSDAADTDTDRRGAVAKWLTKHKENAKRPEPATIPNNDDADDDAELISLGSLTEAQRYSAETLAKSLELLDLEWAFDVRKSRPQQRPIGQTHWEDLDKYDVSRAFDLIRQKITWESTKGPKPLSFGSDSRMQSLQSLMSTTRFDSFQEWLENLPEWTGTDSEAITIINTWLYYFCELQEAPENHVVGEWVSRFIVLGAVARTYEPGYKLDTIPILAASQGLAKSTILHDLLMPHSLDWFTDNLTLRMTGKERLELILGKVVVEIGEMVGWRKVDIEDWKRFASSRSDSERLAYRWDALPHPRRCVFVATTNEDAPVPNDPTGARRFPCIRLGHHPDRPRNSVAWVDELFSGPIKGWDGSFRQAIWAAALHCWNNNLIKPELTGPTEILANALAQSRMNRDEVFDDAIDQMVAKGVTGLTLAQMARKSGLIGTIEPPEGEVLNWLRSYQRRFSEALRKQYYRSRTRKDGVNLRVWILKDETGPK